MYYIPFISLVIALTHSAIERIVWVLVVPVAQEMERRPLSTSNVWTLVDGLSAIALRITPFTTLGIAVATIGHKVLNSVAEAMVDAYTTQRGIDYPLSRARLSFLLKKSSRLLIFTLVAMAFSIIILVLVHTNAFIEWSGREPQVTAAAWVIIVVQAVFVVVTVARDRQQQKKSQSMKRQALRSTYGNLETPLSGLFLQRPARSLSSSRSTCSSKSPNLSQYSPLHDSMARLTATDDSDASQTGTPGRTARGGPVRATAMCRLTDLEMEWWKRHIFVMRYTAFGLLLMFSILFAVTQGPIFGLTSGVMILCSLNLPHLFGYMALSVSAALIRTLRSYRWLVRHQDALFPCAIILIPYQLVLMNALLYFGHHWEICSLLAGVNALLVARTIDLVREFDVSDHGSIQWMHAETGALLAPSLAIALEDAHEKKYHYPDVVSLEMTIDIHCMKIIYVSGVEVPLRRRVVIPYGAMRRYLFRTDFYAYTVPRLLSLQSPGYFGGSKFRTMRVILRLISMTLLILYAIVVAGLLVQAAFPHLRPIPVRVTAPADNSYLSFDHIVVRMHLLSQEASRRIVEENTSSSLLQGYLSGLPEAASSAFKWNNISSAETEDFYPQLCTRDYGGTSVWELALLSVAPYLFNVEDFNTMLHFLNEHLGSDWVIQPNHGASCVHGDSAHRPTGWTGFYEVYSRQRDMSVITIRGTDMFSLADFLIDINLFFEVGLYQLLASFVPGASVVPKDLVVDLLRTASLPADSPNDVRETWAELTSSKNHSLRQCQQNNYQRDFFADVYNHIAYIGSRKEHPRHIVLTGHSLGGAVATIVAAQMEVKAVAFSAPGVALARKKFRVSLHAIHRSAMTVVSSNDIVPSIGEHGGEVHHVECLAATRELCHAMEFMIGSLWRSCSSIRARFPSIKDVV